MAFPPKADSYYPRIRPEWQSILPPVFCDCSTQRRRREKFVEIMPQKPFQLRQAGHIMQHAFP
jgi:hypothetical protein